MISHSYFGEHCHKKQQKYSTTHFIHTFLYVLRVRGLSCQAQKNPCMQTFYGASNATNSHACRARIGARVHAETGCCTATRQRQLKRTSLALHVAACVARWGQHRVLCCTTSTCIQRLTAPSAFHKEVAQVTARLAGATHELPMRNHLHAAQSADGQGCSHALQGTQGLRIGSVVAHPTTSPIVHRAHHGIRRASGTVEAHRT